MEDVLASNLSAGPTLEVDSNVAEERYLEALNHPLLDNLRPEHIAERARYYKQAIEIALRGQGVPDWIAGIK